MVYGLIELYQADFDTRFLVAAMELNREMLRLFSDDRGDLYDTGADAEIVLRRGRSLHDGALPSGSSLAVLNLLRLARLSGEMELEERGERLLERLLPMAEQNPQGFGQLLIALDYALGPRQEVVICVPESDGRPLKMLAVLRQKLRPGTLVLLQQADDAESSPPLAPLRGKHVVDGQPTAWVCREQSCRAPVTSAEGLGQILDG
ncbi:MAG TPA: thioredoxin domain-containing protein [Geoalkalibacter subterraneus]|uniref:Thioredoxin domain-containing protein n=1 Tax=Geoalkalibacter subterraneus TaxID=483547 RepID=A0A831LQH3_9BACT|nr:thioredoxin domain-containing protein [Geoalkalibacter subterraneus]